MNIKCHICGEYLKPLNHSAWGINSFRCDEIYKDYHHLYIEFIEKEVIFYSSAIYDYRLIGNFNGNYTEVYDINSDNLDERITINKFLNPLGIDNILNFDKIFEKIMRLKIFT